VKDDGTTTSKGEKQIRFWGDNRKGSGTGKVQQRSTGKCNGGSKRKGGQQKALTALR
jgi:hypothetical protein